MKFTLQNETGLHARPAALVVAESKKYQAQINFIKDNQTYSAKSILSVMAMEATQGDVIEIECIGEDAEAAQQGLIQLLESL